jgi:hypothetical protein
VGIPAGFCPRNTCSERAAARCAQRNMPLYKNGGGTQNSDSSSSLAEVAGERPLSLINGEAIEQCCAAIGRETRLTATCRRMSRIP